MIKIEHYKIPDQRYFDLEIPRHAELLGIFKLPGKAEHQLFAMAEMTEPKETRSFRLVESDQEITQADHEVIYVGTFSYWSGNVVETAEICYHLLELI